MLAVVVGEPMSDLRFAILDFETTGISPRSHRIIEIGLVHLDMGGEVTGRWETLLNPGRDLGPQRIHGIRAADVLRAPTFADVASELLDLLQGRVLAAHNASFDVRFLVAELERLGISPPVQWPEALCTMRLARELLPGTRRSLADCCAAFDIELREAHRALDDAMATAQLLASYLRENPGHECWSTYEESARQLTWPTFVGPRSEWLPRPRGGEDEAAFLERIAEQLPDRSGPDEHQEYLALLDRCLVDRRLSMHEQEELVERARLLGMDRSTCMQLHEAYFEDLRQMAWDDHHLTDEEAHDLRTVARLLSLSEARLAQALAGPDRSSALPAPGPAKAATRFRLEPGARITLTGQMERERDDWYAELSSLGFIPSNGVSKMVNLVVAADPDSLSGKARKAREYGIPIVDEVGLVALLARR